MTKDIEKQSPNIALSGWVGAGTTSLTLMLSKLFQLKFVPATQIFRVVDKKISELNNFQSLSKESEETYQPLVGKTIDNYIDHKLLNDSGFILESDIAAFRIGKHPKVFSIFLKASTEERLKRTSEELARQNEADLSERDNALQGVYKDLWDIDIFDEELIDRKYNLVIDTSEINYARELEIVVEAMKLHPTTKNAYDWEKINNSVEKISSDYEKNGKEPFLNNLAKNNLLMTNQEMLLEITKLFPEDIAGYPPELQKVFLDQE